MKLLLTSCAFICLILSALQQRDSEGWRGIVPLQSTRADVERLLGPSDEKCQCFYKSKNENIFVHYSEGFCSGFLDGWAVAKDTVLMITVRPNTDVRFSDLSLDLAKYVKTAGADTPQVYYTDNDAGIKYQVSESGIVRAVDFIPKRADYSLRCKGFPSAPDLGHRQFKPFDAYGKIPRIDEQARLENFSIWLRDQPQMKGYMLVYGSKDFPSRKALRWARRAKEYIVRHRGMKPNRIAIIDGGHREQFGIELYMLPRDVAPPFPYPTIVPNKTGRTKSLWRE